MADVAIISPVLGFLTANHLALLTTPLQTYLAHLNLLKARDFKGFAFSGIHSISLAHGVRLYSLEEGLGTRLMRVQLTQ